MDWHGRHACFSKGFYYKIIQFGDGVMRHSQSFWAEILRQTILFCRDMSK